MHKLVKNDSASLTGLPLVRSACPQPVAVVSSHPARQITCATRLMQFAPERAGTQIQVFLRWLIAVGFDSSNQYVRRLTLSHVRHTGGGLPPGNTRQGLAASFIFPERMGTAPASLVDRSNKVHVELAFRSGRRRRPTSRLGYLLKIGPAASSVLSENAHTPTVLTKCIARPGPCPPEKCPERNHVSFLGNVR